MHVSENDNRVFDITPSQNHQSPPAEGDSGNLPKWNEVMTVVRKAIEERSKASNSEKTAVLADLSNKLYRQPKPKAGGRKRFLHKVDKALKKSDPVPALQDVIAESKAVPQSRKKSQPQEKKPVQRVLGRSSAIPSDPAEDESPVESNSQSNVPRVDLEHVQAHMDIPSASDYPNAPVVVRKALDPLDAGALRVHFKDLCARQHLQINTKEKLIKNDKATEWTCDLSLDPSGPFEQRVTGAGATKSQAADAAYLYAISALHTLGKLIQLLPNLKVEDIEPRREQYPSAPGLLFQAEHIGGTMHNVLDAKKLGAVQTGDYEAHSTGFGTFTLRLDIPGIADATATGMGVNKAMAKRAAWVAMLNRLHTHGALQQIFPQASVYTPSQARDNNESQVFIRDESEIELVELDSHVVKQEKDAKVDIYNYAAKYGIVPEFETETVQHATRRERKKKSVKRVAQASIRLPEHGINIVTRGKDAPTAEAAAALAFKREAEQQQTSEDQERSRTPVTGYELLTTDTAQDFVEWYRRLHSGMTLEVEHSPVSSGGSGANRAQILLDGSVRGESIMRVKKDAQNVAYLIAAIAIANSSPQYLTQWVERKKSGEDQRMMRSLNVPIETEVLDLMRDTLVRARKAGLPDQRETFGAEEETRAAFQSRRRYLSSLERDNACANHQESLEQFQQDPRLEQLRTTKASLPMSQYTNQVMEIVSRDVYSIIIGATGSGKTTQVPQILLDQAIESGKGGYCDIICTQPRRLAASSVAQRVAAERDEKIGQSVGYQVRGDVRLPQFGGSITYCTTGILLEQLKWNADDIMDNVSHLVIDEVHERDIFVDFLLIILKKAVKARQEAGKKIPHIVLMSATLDKKLFSEYLPNLQNGLEVPCPSLSVPGRTFPVAEKYLAELVAEISSTHKAEFESLLREDKGISQDYVNAELSFAHNATDAEPVIIDWKRQYEADSDSEGPSPAEQKIESLVPVHLLAAALGHICNKSSDGAILAFLPGLQEITAAQNFLLQQPIFGVDFSDTTQFNIMPLHSTVPPDQQKLIFEPSPPGCRKIILATNIAETSVTVPDVKFVVDLGKMREKRYDQVKRISELQTVWESNSNARQRAGRAGRVSDGNYYALYTQQRRQAMSASGQPELLRTDLQETCLSIKAQGFQEPVSEFLADAIEPPSTRAVSLAVENLKSIEAFTDEEKLTSLGRILSRLPVHPTLGNMVLLGIVFRCLDPMIISSCLASERSLFVSPLGVARTASRQKHKLYEQDNSDHLAFINAFKDLRTNMNERGMSAAFSHAQDRFLHFGAFKSMEQTTQSIEQALREAGLITSSYQDRRNGYQLGGEALNANSNNTALVKALTLAGVYPNIAVRRAGAKAPVHRTVSEDKVMMHPASLNTTTGRSVASETDQVYAYNTLARSVNGDNLFMRDTTLITPLIALLFGGRLQTRAWKTLIMDDWLPFSPNALNTEFAVRLLLEFRKAKDRMLYGAFKDLSDPRRGMIQDEAREIFASGLVDVLKKAQGPGRKTNTWYPDSWQQSRRGMNDRRDRGQSEGGRFNDRSDDVRNQSRGEESSLIRFT